MRDEILCLKIVVDLVDFARVYARAEGTVVRDEPIFALRGIAIRRKAAPQHSIYRVFKRTTFGTNERLQLGCDVVFQRNRRAHTDIMVRVFLDVKMREDWGRKA